MDNLVCDRLHLTSVSSPYHWLPSSFILTAIWTIPKTGVPAQDPLTLEYPADLFLFSRLRHHCFNETTLAGNLQCGHNYQMRRHSSPKLVLLSTERSPSRHTFRAYERRWTLIQSIEVEKQVPISEGCALFPIMPPHPSRLSVTLKLPRPMSRLYHGVSRARRRSHAVSQLYRRDFLAQEPCGYSHLSSRSGLIIGVQHTNHSHHYPTAPYTWTVLRHHPNSPPE